MVLPFLAEMAFDYETSFETSDQLSPIISLISSAVGLGIGLVGYLVMAFVLFKIAKKLDAENAWWAWVPGLNFALTYQLGDQKAWYALLMFIPCVNIVGLVFWFIAWAKILEKLGKPTWHLVFFFIPVVNFIYMITLAL